MQDISTLYYGNLNSLEQGQYPLAAWIWGHRLRSGQHWMEYLLEFLNVLSGFEYQFGQGITNEGTVDIKYKRFERIGLRRFTFYDDQEKYTDSYDDEALRVLEQSIADFQKIQADDSDAIILAKSLLRSFSAVEEQRSWFAKSLFPAHDRLLFFEGAARKKSRNGNRSSIESIRENEDYDRLDKDLQFDRRNFFARGGELYYLILSAGTQDAPELRNRITQNLKKLLFENNALIGKLAQIIDELWLQLAHGDEAPSDEDLRKGSLGWIPINDKDFYRIVAEDVDGLLRSEIDSLEMLELLAHQICFHLALYIYRLAVDSNLTSNEELNRLSLLIDITSDRQQRVLNGMSQMIYQDYEARIDSRAKSYVDETINDFADQLAKSGRTGADFDELRHLVESRFGLKGLSKKKRDSFKKALGSKQDDFEQGKINWKQLLQAYKEATYQLLNDDFKKNFKPVHRKLTKSIGFVSPKKGPGAYYTLGDSLLKALTLAIVQSNQNPMTYDDFLACLYQRYGLVVGVSEARLSGLFDVRRINVEYYEQNRAALLQKMLHAGLAEEYSDATAMIVGTRE